MRESFILIILPLLVIAVRCSHVDRNTYNLYKDYPPLQEFEYLNIPVWLTEYKKRASNEIKKRTMDQIMQDDKRLKKRTSKAALSLMMQSKQDPGNVEEENSCFAGK